MRLLGLSSAWFFAKPSTILNTPWLFVDISPQQQAPPGVCSKTVAIGLSPLGPS